MNKNMFVLIISFLSLLAALIFMFQKPQYRDSSQLLRNVRCLSCNGQAVLDSESAFSLSVKSFVHSELSKGKSVSEIALELKELYGEQIFFTDSSSPLIKILYFFPLLFLIIFIVKFAKLND